MDNFADSDFEPAVPVACPGADHEHRSLTFALLTICRRSDRWLANIDTRNRPLLVGISGAQGTGKSTLAKFMEMAMSALFGWRWRRYDIDALADGYTPIVERLHVLIFLAAPSFDAIGEWRIEQERILRAERECLTSAIMADDEIVRFIQYFERITRYNLDTIPNTADVTLVLGEDLSVARWVSARCR